MKSVFYAFLFFIISHLLFVHHLYLRYLLFCTKNKNKKVMKISVLIIFTVLLFIILCLVVTLYIKAHDSKIKTLKNDYIYQEIPFCFQIYQKRILPSLQQLSINISLGFEFLDCTKLQLNISSKK